MSVPELSVRWVMNNLKLQALYRLKIPEEVMDMLALAENMEAPPKASAT